MFFIMGISSGVKQLEFLQTMICKKCGRFGRMNVFMRYQYFSLFFIPLFKFGKQFYVQTSCCGTVYQLSPEIGRQILRGESVTLTDSDLQYMGDSPSQTACPNCGYPLDSGFDFCPKCGSKLR